MCVYLCDNPTQLGSSDNCSQHWQNSRLLAQLAPDECVCVCECVSVGVCVSEVGCVCDLLLIRWGVCVCDISLIRWGVCVCVCDISLIRWGVCVCVCVCTLPSPTPSLKGEGNQSSPKPW